MPNTIAITQHSDKDAQAQAPFPTHDNWVKLSNGCFVSKFITVGELLEMVSLSEAQNVISTLLNK